MKHNLSALLDKLEKLEKKATPGPWRYDWGNQQIEKEEDSQPVVDICTRWGTNKKDGKFLPENYDHNGVFIEQSRNALRVLIKALREAIAIIEDAGKEYTFAEIRRKVFLEKWI